MVQVFHEIAGDSKRIKVCRSYIYSCDVHDKFTCCNNMHLADWNRVQLQQ